MTAPIIDPLPPSPNPLDPRTFATSGVVFAQALPTFRAQLNALGEYINVTLASFDPSVLEPFANAAAASASTAGDNAAAAILSASEAGASAEAAALSTAEAQAARDLAQTYATTVSGTSTSALEVGTGSKLFVTQAGKQWQAGQRLRAVNADATRIMDGEVSSYTVDQLTLLVDYTEGTGTDDDWRVMLSGARGGTGATGAPGIDGVDGTDGADGALLMGRRTLTSGATLMAGDAGKLIDCAGTFTVAYEAAATLGDGWFAYVRNSGTGTITHNPDGAELINDETTYAQFPGSVVVVRCTGTAFEIVWQKPTTLLALPILSEAAADFDALSSGETLNPPVAASPVTVPSEYGLGVYFNGLYILAPSSGSNVYTSPDGATWTARAMPSSQAWRLGTDGTQVVAIANAGTATAVSSNGTSWSAATATPAAVTDSPMFVGSRVLVLSNASGTTAYYSDNYGTSWTTVTLPVSHQQMYPSALGLFAYGTGTTNYYTSATGATGTWTARTAPESLSTSALYYDPYANLIRLRSDGDTHRTADWINWTTEANTPPLGPGNWVFYARGDLLFAVSSSAGLGNAQTRHNGRWVIRNSASGNYLFPIYNPTTGQLLFVSSSQPVHLLDLSVPGLFGAFS